MNKSAVKDARGMYDVIGLSAPLTALYHNKKAFDEYFSHPNYSCVIFAAMSTEGIHMVVRMKIHHNLRPSPRVVHCVCVLENWGWIGQTRRVTYQSTHVCALVGRCLERLDGDRSTEATFRTPTVRSIPPAVHDVALLSALKQISFLQL